MTISRFRPMSLPCRRHFNYVRRAAIAIALTAVLAHASAQAAAPPMLLVLPLDMVDTSGEIPPRVKEHNDRVTALTQYLAKALAESGSYAIADPTPIAAAIDQARSAQPLGDCNGCERDLARLVHAGRVLIGEIDKVSTLIGSLRLQVIDVATGRRVFERMLSFRGDTGDAWQHAARFFVRDLAADPASR